MPGLHLPTVQDDNAGVLHRSAGAAAATRPHPVSLRADDGVALAALHWPAANREIGCVVGHGFTGSSRNSHVQRICRALAARGMGVLSPDFRGHGRSGGAATAGADEVYDIAAAVRWLQHAGYRQVAILGWSMGGTSVLRYAGLGGSADAVVSVSAPGTWWERGTRPMRIAHWMFESRTGRVTTRMLRRTRIESGGWATLPEAPADVVGSITVPLLLVHGDADPYFPLQHPEALAAAAPSATVWIEPAMGHAEIATTAAQLERIADWLRDALGAVQPAEQA